MSALYIPHAVFADDGKFINWLKAKDIPEFLLNIIDILLVFALPLIILYIMYAGYLFVTAQGNPGKVTEARTALLWAVVGGVIVLGAKIIVDVIQQTAGAL
ncbi:hypothetical protein IPH92_02265 [Candidatus Kaiserbacteria bacterium]|nr:MAG: hypothetical protein IPH92_02265 [Candidatus Kaiserbacteria bacterium]